MDTQVLPKVTAMAFHHSAGFVPAWRQAMRFAGEGGRVATLPDMIEARIKNGPDSPVWSSYFTTSSAEYFGRSRGGSRIIIVAHEVGPMSTLTGILKAYSFEYTDKSRNSRGGRIPIEEFRNLESGKYGEVAIVDFEKYLQLYKYPFSEHLTPGRAKEDPLLRARLGPRYAVYLAKHANVSNDLRKKDGLTEDRFPIIIEARDASNCPYAIRSRDEGGYVSSYLRLNKTGAVAHLLAISQIMHTTYGRGGSGFVSDISCHEWTDGVRLLGVRKGSPLSPVHPGAGYLGHLIARKWRSLMEPAEGTFSFGSLIKVDKDTWFTEIPKKGARMDTGEPEFLVNSLEKIGKPVNFVTSIGGYYGFFKYDVREVREIAPEGANAYSLVSDPDFVYSDGAPPMHGVKIQFYRARVNTRRRVVREDQLANDFDRIMELLEE